MIPAQEFVATLASFAHMPYDAGDFRLEPDHNGTDCSGLGWRALTKLGDSPGPYQNSTGMQEWCASHGLIIPVERAIRIPGAALFIWGYGPQGHEAYVSDQPGLTWETPAWGDWGHACGQAVSDPSVRHWTGAGLFPNIDYSHTAPVPDPAPAFGRDLVRGDTGGDVRTLQTRLVFWCFVNKTGAYDPHGIDGIFGAGTDQAVRAFQEAKGLQVDGIVGPITWAVLWAF